MLIVFTNKPITTHIFASWSILVMISSLNDYRNLLLNHVQSLSLSKLTTCTIEVTSSLSIKNANSQPNPASFSYSYSPQVHATQHACHTYVHFQGMRTHLRGQCELYMPCPHIVIHTHVYYYKMAAYADRQVCTSDASMPILVSVSVLFLAISVCIGNTVNARY